VDNSEAATSRDVVRRLLDARLIGAEQAVDGDVVVRNLSRSNGVFSVVAGELEYVVKGPGLAGAEGHGSLEREGRLYARIGRDPRFADLALAPRLVRQVDGLLVLGRPRPGVTLEERWRQEGPSIDALHLLGRAVGTWRRLSNTFADLVGAGRLPWVLESLETPPPEVVAENPGAKRLAEALRAEGTLRDGLAALRSRWRRDAVIHGDVRWDNALVERDAASGRERVVLVDWELLDRGDAGWDVAGALADAVALAAVSPNGAQPTGDAYRPATRDEVARWWPELTHALHAFSEGYRAEAPRDVVQDDLRSGTALLPARVLNIAFLNAAWDVSSGFASGLALAAIAGALFESGIEPLP
jgi:Phosphotransferase enzyme family